MARCSPLIWVSPKRHLLHGTPASAPRCARAETRSGPVFARDVGMAAGRSACFPVSISDGRASVNAGRLGIREVGFCGALEKGPPWQGLCLRTAAMSIHRAPFSRGSGSSCHGRVITRVLTNGRVRIGFDSSPEWDSVRHEPVVAGIIQRHDVQRIEAHSAQPPDAQPDHKPQPRDYKV